MKEFMDKDFLLESDTAKHLYFDYAEKMPIIDYHCHISPKEIYEDRRFNDISEAWLEGDHYKWRVMRSNGVPEQYITGDKPGYEKFEKFIGALEMAIGNPMYHWCSLEMRRFFGYDKPLCTENVKDCWDFVNDKLKNDPSLTVRGMIERSNVKFIGTTDDPADTLEWHKKLMEDKTFNVTVAPSFRPDKAVNISKPGFAEYVAALANSVGKSSLDSVFDVYDALSERLEFFASLGCRAADHGLDYVPYRPASDERVNRIYKSAMAGNPVSVEDAERYQTALLMHLGREYSRLGIVMQLHYSCKRNANTRIFKSLGPDAGVDMIAQNSCGGNIADFLGALDDENSCPKTIIYSLNPADNEQIDSLIGCFQTDEVPGKIQHGSAWWFSDTKSGMESQMRSLANLGILGNFIGMLTDSRSFLSYARHEYFRRIMCNVIGGWVENGEYPNNDKALKKIVRGICCDNAARYFNL